jgi:hypothetical protein
MHNILNRAATKKLILKKLESMRPHLGITRVSKDALDRYEYWLVAKIIEDIRSHPTLGKTFQPYSRS